MSLEGETQTENPALCISFDVSSQNLYFESLTPSMAVFENRSSKLKLQYFSHLMRTVDSLEKTLMLVKTEGFLMKVKVKK